MTDQFFYTPFITGSMAYGTPNESSDVDLAVLMKLEDLSALADKADSFAGSPGNDLSLRFGRLNLLVFIDAVKYGAWNVATSELVAMKPVTREAAIAHINALMERMAVPA